jgi:two-component system chemotaxis sensor kinase CheA
VHVVVVTGPAGELGLVVDALLGQQEIVIKALDDYLGQAPGISGATILGDGRVVLIVDVPTLLEAHGGAGRSAAVRAGVA